MRFIDCINITGESCKAYKGNKEYISTGAVDVDHIDRNQIEIVNYDSKPSRANLITDDKSILFAKMQGTKKVLLIDQELDKNIYSTGFFSVAPKQNVLKKECLYYLLGSKTFLSQKDKYCSGATQKAITLEGLKKIEITVPNLEEQDRIAEILDIINSLLESYKEELGNYDKLVKARFVEMFGEADKFETKPLEDSVEEMFIGPFGSSLKNDYFVSSDKGYCMVYEQKHAIKKTMNVDTRYVDENKYKELRRFTVRGGDIIVSCRGTIGETYIVPENAPIGIMHPSIMKIRLKSSVYNRICFNYLLQNALKRHKAEANGSGVKMAVTATALGKELFIRPSMDLQTQFAAFVKQVDKSKYDGMFI